MFHDLRSLASFQQAVLSAPPSTTLVVEWVSPTCKHCFAAQSTTLAAAEAINEQARAPRRAHGAAGCCC